MKRFVLAVLVFGLIWGCQKQAEQGAQGDAQQGTTERASGASEQDTDDLSMSPPPRVSENSKIWLTSSEGKAGEQVKLDIYYYLSEPAKTLVVPLTYLGNASIDSFSWVGSDLADYNMKPVQVRNDLNILQVAVVPMGEPDIPADTGLVGSVFFRIDEDAPIQTVNIETTFIYPGNTLSYVDTLVGLVTPQWEAGSIKVVK